MEDVNVKEDVTEVVETDSFETEAYNPDVDGGCDEEYSGGSGLFGKLILGVAAVGGIGYLAYRKLKKRKEGTDSEEKVDISELEEINPDDYEEIKDEPEEVVVTKK